jgi:tetratricopeptide (TPR) repeat protein
MSKTKSVSLPKKTSSQKRSSTSTGSEMTPVLQYSLLAGILLLTLLVYWPAIHNGFVWDDTVYVQRNPLIHTLDLQEIFSSYLAGNYHPVTVLVLAIEYGMFGLKESGYHVVNILLHLANTLLTFFLIRKFSNNLWVGLITMLIFGVHPLHVESVAWISALKDLLYTLFFLASLLAYLRYVDHKKNKWYAIALGFFVLSLLSKAVAVALPVVLLLVDYLRGRTFNQKVGLEKIPFFVLSLVFGVVAIYAQQSEDAIQADSIPVIQRIVFAFHNYITYIHQLILPVSLSAYYPYPIGSRETIPVVYYTYIPITLGVLFLAWKSLRQSKKVLFGLGFYSITIFLILRLLPVGFTITADRHAYIASIGIIYLFAEGLYWLYRNKPSGVLSMAAVAAGIGFTAFYSYATFQRCKVWKNELTLWTDTIEKDNSVHMAFLNRGVYHLDTKNYALAEADLAKAIELDPTYAKSYYNRGMVYQQQRKLDAAMQDYNKSIELNPNLANAFINRGNTYKDMNQFELALADYERAIVLDPSMLESYNNKGVLLQNMGNAQAALDSYSKVLQLSPNYFSALVNRAGLYSKSNQLELAMQDYTKAVAVNPNAGSAYYGRGLVYNKLAETSKACADFQQAINLGYQNAQNAFAQNCR